MKINFLFGILTVLISGIGNAQSLKPEWAKQTGGTGEEDMGISASTDKHGNVYTIGSFSGTVDFDPNAGVFNLTATGISDIFIQKLGPDGNFKWAKQIDNEWASSIATDVKGNVYTTGNYYDTVDFDPGPGIFNLVSNGNADMFIQKLDSSGSFKWAKQIGGMEFDWVLSLKADAGGFTYITGLFGGTVDFDPGAGVFNMVSKGNDDVFVLKLDSTGSLVWSRQIGGADNETANSITTEFGKSICLTGHFEGTADFNPGTGIFNLSSNGLDDIFILKLDPNGNFLWATQAGGKGYDYGNSITSDSKGNIYTTGFFENTVDFDPGTGVFNLICNGGSDGFIQKLDSNGNLLWIKQIGGTGRDNGSCISTSIKGDIYSTGSFSNTTDFDPGAGILNMVSNGFTDVYILKLDSSGNFLWAKTLGGTDSDHGTSIVSYNDDIYHTGTFSGAMYFDAGLGLTSYGGYDAFTAKFSPCTSSPTTYTQTITACHSYTANHQTFTESGVYGQIIGCDSILLLNLTIIPAGVSVLQNGNTLSSSITGTSYQWIDCNNGNTPITGATNQHFTPALDGIYAVIVITNGCPDTSFCYPFIINGINDEDVTENKISISPNPFQLQTILQTEETLKNATLTVFNSFGQTVKQINNISGNTIVLHQDNLPAGVYFAHLQDGQQFSAHKLIIRD